jgi:hypothetical protein
MQFSIKSGVLVFAIAMSSVVGMQSASLADASSRQGCMNQWLFNGVWRVRVTAVEPYMSGTQQMGWQVTELWRNGTSGETSPSDAQLLDQQLELQSGSISAKGSTAGTMSLGSLGFNTFAPAGELTYKQIFYQNNVDPSNKPKGLAITFNGTLLAQLKSKPQFTTAKYNFHFDLNCVASGAAANAEGGSNQITATSGCMNQWMSNGVWKMRVTGIVPSPPDAAPQDVNGWRAIQTWINITNRKLWPGGLYGTGEAPSNVSDEFLATQSGNNASSFNTVGGFSLGSRNITFPPGGSFTFSQLFIGGGLNGTDKPVRLLVTFNATTQNALAGMPHYHMPADFRIDLTCTK